MPNGTDLPENNSSKDYRTYLKSLTDLNWDGDDTLSRTELTHQFSEPRELRAERIRQASLSHSQSL